MLGMWDVQDVGCSRCGMCRMWDVWDVGCVGCGMFGMCHVGDVGCAGCGMFGMWDVWDVGCGMWDVDLQNFESFLKTGTTFAILKTERKTPVMKERLNKSVNCFEISFFRRNNIL